MATRAIRAVYTGGQIRPLEPVTLVEGQEVELRVIPEEEQVRAVWDDSLGLLPLLPNGDLDEEALLQEIYEETRSLPSLSEELIEERRNGP